jgi:hypothetical protein
MRVTLVQPLGDRMDVVLATERHPHAVAQMPSYTGLCPGDSLPIYFDLSRAHYFETGERGQRLAGAPAPSR